MIEVKNLVKQYGKNIVVNHLDFHIKKGQVCGFLGPNGAGKSTTMNMITGYIAMTDGEVKINGYDIFEEPEKAKKCIGYLPEIPPVYMDMTPYEYLKFAAELKGIESEERKAMVADVMEMTKITHMKNRLIKNLSKGYRQRVGLAQALLGDPEVLILDEPTVGLDPGQIIQMRQLIRELGKNHTIILSSHILSEISEVCDHVLIISNGNLVANDSMANLQKRCEGSNILQMTVKGKEQDIVGILEKVQGLKEYKIQSSALDAGAWDIYMEQAEGVDVREFLFHTFVKEGCVVLMMKNDRLTLEEIFLDLTRVDEPVYDVYEETETELPDFMQEDNKEEA